MSKHGITKYDFKRNLEKRREETNLYKIEALRADLKRNAGVFALPTTEAKDYREPYMVSYRWNRSKALRDTLWGLELAVFAHNDEDGVFHFHGYEVLSFTTDIKLMAGILDGNEDADIPIAEEVADAIYSQIIRSTSAKYGGNLHKS